MKKKRVRTIALVLMATILLVGGIYAVFVSTRFSTFTTYVPFSGQVFSISPDDIIEISIQNGSNGQTVSISNKSDQQDLLDKINGLRYNAWFPKIPVKKAVGPIG
ncbi:hypothetical protein [Oscillibacter sp.]|uniref:hypothetical protein n=1 Tax=Oscillibacter sp. TaxID=1945593 RepID=UPI0028AC80E6|nr:hypothetical protein [Oscillibacter sp.]